MTFGELFYNSSVNEVVFKKKYKKLNKIIIQKTILMKTSMILRTGITLMFVAGLSINIFANNNPKKSNGTTAEEKSVSSMQIKVPSNLNTYVVILNQEGKTIHSDKVSKESFLERKYDLSNLDNGVYTVITESDLKSVEKTIRVESNGLSVLKEESRYHPSFSIDGDYLMVNYLNVNNDDVSIVLEDATSRYFRENGVSDMVYGKKLDIKRLKMGKYTVALKSGGNTYNYSFNK